MRALLIVTTDPFPLAVQLTGDNANESAALASMAARDHADLDFYFDTTATPEGPDRVVMVLKLKPPSS